MPNQSQAPALDVGWPELEQALTQAFDAAWERYRAPEHPQPEGFTYADGSTPPVGDPEFLDWVYDDFPDEQGKGSDWKTLGWRYVQQTAADLARVRVEDDLQLERFITVREGDEINFEGVGIHWTTNLDSEHISGTFGAPEETYGLHADVPLTSVDWVETIYHRLAFPLENEVTLIQGAPLTLWSIEQDPWGMGDDEGEELVRGGYIEATAARRPVERNGVTVWIDRDTMVVNRGPRGNEQPLIHIRKMPFGYFIVPGDERPVQQVDEATAYQETLAVGATDQDFREAFPQHEMRFAGEAEADPVEQLIRAQAFLPTWLYHVTTADRLESIAEEGLGGGRPTRSGWAAGYSAGDTFFTEAAGVDTWFRDVGEHVEQEHEPEDHASRAPVLLRVAVDQLDPQLIEHDAEGTRDATHQASRYRGQVPPEAIEAWTGGEWVPIGDAPDLSRLTLTETRQYGDEPSYPDTLFLLPKGWDIEAAAAVPPPLPEDLADAVEAAQAGDPSLTLADLVEVKRERVGLRDLPADLNSWAEWEPGELAALQPADRRQLLEAFRGPGWIDRAEQWIAAGDVPTVVVVSLPDQHPEWSGSTVFTDLADGRGRVSVALGMGWPTVPVAFYEHRTLRTAQQTLSADRLTEPQVEALLVQTVLREHYGLDCQVSLGTGAAYGTLLVEGPCDQGTAEEATALAGVHRRIQVVPQGSHPEPQGSDPARLDLGAATQSRRDWVDGMDLAESAAATSLPIGGTELTAMGRNRFDIDNFRDGRCRKVVQQIAREYQARGGPGTVGPSTNQYEIVVKLPGGGEITAGVDPMDPTAIMVEAPRADGGLAMESAEDPAQAAEIMIRMSALDLKAGKSYVGYRCVPIDEAGQAFSAYDQSVPYSLEIGSIADPPDGLFLGTTRQFVETFYTGLTDGAEAILTYTYDSDDVLAGDPDTESFLGGEVRVRRAKLVAVDRIALEASSGAWYHGSTTTFDHFDRGPVFMTQDYAFAAHHAPGSTGVVYEVEPLVQRTFDASALVGDRTSSYWPPPEEELTELGQRFLRELEALYGNSDGNKEDNWHVFHDSEGLWPQLLNGYWGAVEQPEVLEILQRLGFDSFRVRGEGTEALAVFDPANVRIVSMAKKAASGRPLTEDELAEVHAHETASFDGTMRDFTWTLEWVPPADFGWAKADAETWLNEEREFRESELGYDSIGQISDYWLPDPSVEPIIVTESSEGNLPKHDVWDGWHRLALSIVNGLDRVPVFLGRRMAVQAQADTMTIWRGLRMVVVPEGQDYTNPDVVLDLLMSTAWAPEGLGRHWSRSRRIAERFAGPYPPTPTAASSDPGYKGPRGTSISVLVSATVPSDVKEGWAHFTDHIPGEEAVVLDPGTPMQLDSISLWDGERWNTSKPARTITATTREAPRTAMSRPIPRDQADQWAAGSALPDVYYHGTDDPSFDELDARPSWYQYGGGIGAGIYVSPNYDGAKFYGNHVFEVKLNVQNPLNIDDSASYTDPQTESERIKDEIAEPGHATRERFIDWLLDYKEDDVRDTIARLEGFTSDDEIDALMSDQYGATNPDQLTFDWAPEPEAESGIALYVMRHFEAFQEFEERFVESEIEDMGIDSSQLIGEQVSPFYLYVGNEVWTVGFKRPDLPDAIELDLYDVGAAAQSRGYDAVVWDARQPAGEILIFDPDKVAIIEDTLAPEMEAQGRTAQTGTESFDEDDPQLDQQATWPEMSKLLWAAYQRLDHEAVIRSHPQDLRYPPGPFSQGVSWEADGQDPIPVNQQLTAQDHSAPQLTQPALEVWYLNRALRVMNVGAQVELGTGANYGSWVVHLDRQDLQTVAQQVIDYTVGKMRMPGRPLVFVQGGVGQMITARESVDAVA